MHACDWNGPLGTLCSTGKENELLHRVESLVYSKHTSKSRGVLLAQVSMKLKRPGQYTRLPR